MKRISTLKPKSRGGVGWWGGDRLCQTRLIPRSPDGDNKIKSEIDFPELGLNCLLASYLITCLLPKGRVKEMEIFDGICHEGGRGGESRVQLTFFQKCFF